MAKQFTFMEATRMQLTLLDIGWSYGEPPSSWLDALCNAPQRTHAGTVPLSLGRVRSFSRAFVLVGGPAGQIRR